MVGSEYTYCPMCGCEDGQGCSKDCPSEVMPRLRAENAKLRAALRRVLDSGLLFGSTVMHDKIREQARAVLGGEK